MKAIHIKTVEDFQKYVKRRIDKGLSWCVPLRMTYYGRGKSTLHNTGATLVVKAIDKLSIKQKISSSTAAAYHLAVGLKSIPTCSVCGSNLDWVCGKYKSYCSRACSGASKDRLKKFETSMLSLYGVTNPSYSKSMMEKGRETTFKRLGVRHHWMSSEVRDKMKDTMLIRYGVENASYSEDMKRKCRKTWRKKYGTSHPMKNEEVKAKIIATNQRRRGVDWTVQDPEIQKRISQTNRERIGVDRPAQNHAIHAKIVSSSNRSKSFEIQGRCFTGLQGYEPQAIRHLVEDLGYNPRDIINHPSKTFEWEDRHSKVRYYHPDFKIRGEKYIIEVKSEWTLRGRAGSWRVNKAKRDAVLKAGYIFSFLIIRERKPPVWRTYYPD